MLTITLTIGRNYGKSAIHPGVPMSDDDWEKFIQNAEEALLANTYNRLDTWTEIHRGQGEWDGVVEESAKVSILDVILSNPEPLKAAVRELATRYHQDAIAIAIGDSELVTA